MSGLFANGISAGATYAEAATGGSVLIALEGCGNASGWIAGASTAGVGSGTTTDGCSTTLFSGTGVSSWAAVTTAGAGTGTSGAMATGWVEPVTVFCGWF